MPMENNLMTKKISLLFLVLWLVSCGSSPDARYAPRDVMHFPFALKKLKSNLIAASTSTDGKYDHGRLVSLNIEDNPIDYTIESNVLIPKDVSLIDNDENNLYMTFRSTNELISLPLKDDKFTCGNEETLLYKCPGVKKIQLERNDPYSFVIHDEKILLSYLSSSEINIIDSKTLKVEKKFDALEWLQQKLDKKFAEEKVVTKKIFISDHQVYFLFDLYPSKGAESTVSPSKSYIVRTSLNELLNADEIKDSDISLWDLYEQYGISSSADIYVKDKLAYVLTKAPEALHKIDLEKKSLLQAAIVCAGVSSMAVDEESDLIAIPCFNDNKVASFSMSSLKGKAVSKDLGRGPSFVAIDSSKKEIYVAVSNDGIVVILNLETLESKSHIFNKAPQNRMGS